MKQITQFFLEGESPTLVAEDVIVPQQASLFKFKC